jgi:hypothetical protein
MAKLAVGGIGFALSFYTLLFKSASMVVWSGTQPSTPETTVTGGNTTLATFTFSTAPFSTFSNAAGFDVQTAAFVSNTVTPTNNGTATFARISFTLATSHSGAWTTAQAYTLGDIVTSNASYWLCIGAGTAGSTAPTGTNVLSFDDGGAVWTWIQTVTTGQTIGDFTVGTTTAYDVQVNSTTFSTLINQTITSFQLQSPAF